MSDYLPIEVVTDILKWLPVKSLLRFRCVCTTWDSLITSPHFVSLHLNRRKISDSSDNALTLVRYYSRYRRSEIYSVHPDSDKFEEDRQEIEFPFKGESRYCCRIVGFCNGVLCLTNDDMFGCTDRIILWNPSIRRYLSVRGQCSRSENNGFVEVSVFGFGVDAKTNGLKVVKLRYIDREDGEFLVPFEVEVYEVGSRGWRRIQVAIPYPVLDYFWSHAYINGVCHWIAYHVYKNNEVRSFRSLIMSFDLGSEEFGELNLPQPLRAVSPLKLSITMFGGSLSVLQYDRRAWANSCSIWVMKEYGNDTSWSYHIKVDLHGILGVLCLWQNGDMLLSTEIGELLSYNQDTEMFKRTGVRGTKDSFYVDSYMESLVLLTEGRMVQERDACLGESNSEESSSDEESDQYTRDGIALLMQLDINRFFSALSHDQ